MANKFEHKENRGSLFPNKNKQTGSHPDYKGSGDINGTSMWISGWNTTSKSGLNYISLSFSPMDENYENNNATYSKQPIQQVNNDNSIIAELDDDSIPF